MLFFKFGGFTVMIYLNILLFTASWASTVLKFVYPTLSKLSCFSFSNLVMFIHHPAFKHVDFFSTPAQICLWIPPVEFEFSLLYFSAPEIFHLFIWRQGKTCAPQHMCGGQRSTFPSQFFPSIAWVKSRGKYTYPLSHLPSHPLFMCLCDVCARMRVWACVWHGAGPRMTFVSEFSPSITGSRTWAQDSRLLLSCCLIFVCLFVLRFFSLFIDVSILFVCHVGGTEVPVVRDKH